MSIVIPGILPGSGSSESTLQGVCVCACVCVCVLLCVCVCVCVCVWHQNRLEPKIPLTGFPCPNPSPSRSPASASINICPLVFPRTPLPLPAPRTPLSRCLSPSVGDAITQVDGIDTVGPRGPLPLKEISGLLSGPRGTFVTLLTQRNPHTVVPLNLAPVRIERRAVSTLAQQPSHETHGRHNPAPDSHSPTALHPQTWHRERERPPTEPMGQGGLGLPSSMLDANLGHEPAASQFFALGSALPLEPTRAGEEVEYVCTYYLIARNKSLRIDVYPERGGVTEDESICRYVSTDTYRFVRKTSLLDSKTSLSVDMYTAK
jgi:hypothetical protein